MTRLLVTGGSGYLGAEVLRRAAVADPSVELVPTFHKHSPDTPRGIDWIPLDLADTESILAVLRDAQPDAIINTAFAATGDARIASADGAFELASTASRLGVRLVHVSTDVVFEGTIAEGQAYTETDECLPVYAYGTAKLDAELAVAAGDPFAAIVRTSLLYTGDADRDIPVGKHERSVLDAVDAVARGSNLPMFVFFDNEWRNPIQVTDLASALLELAGIGAAGKAARSMCGVLHVAGADTVSRQEFARLIAAANGRDPDLVVGGRNDDENTRRPRNCALDSSRAAMILDTPLRGVRKVLRPPGS